MNPRQLEILQHTLGLDKYGQGEMYRNHFCAGAGDEVICRELIALGYMQQHPTTKWLPYFNCSVTEEGKQAVLHESPKAPKLSRSKKRYRAFVNADSGMTFKEWIQRGAAQYAGVSE